MERSKQLSTQDLRPPYINGQLPDIKGGQPNLLPKSVIDQTFKVWFPMWPESNPSPSRPETVELYWNGQSVGDRSWTSAIPSSELFIEVTTDKLIEGTNRLHYIVRLYNGTPTPSLEHSVTVDRSAPAFGPSSKLEFAAAIIKDGVTFDYLAAPANRDRVEARVPTYITAAPGHTIIGYWEQSAEVSLDPIRMPPLTSENHNQPPVLTFTGDLIRARKDGQRFAMYRVESRAGYTSLQSLAVELKVEARQRPRLLPWPEVEKALGTGEQQTLDPLKATSGAVVVIPDTANIYPQDQVWVQWGVPGSLGAHRAPRPITPGSRRYQIPMPSIAAYIGKSLPVSYGVIDAEEVEWPSVGRKVNIQRILSHNFPTVQCQGLTGGSLSYDKVPATGAVLKMGTWTLMTADQWIMINMTGTGATGPVAYPAIQQRQVTDQEVIGGIGMRGDVTVPKAFLNTLRRNESFSVKVYVSFDGGRTWPPLAAPNFPLLQLTLIN
ncbi:hypothetical protein [Pseudomonas fluorescens]|uniref:Uncharacterized protein n=1 Tax=Pseudomonas fluorescens TaxID=294 RepID=A0A5E7FW71_PSEFL|nr:hypothetical protein [Pseudomonas fluorescens]VVO42872.1 hypothetical protein PS723_06078 [Pseudomonas fluorescens]